MLVVSDDFFFLTRRHPFTRTVGEEYTLAIAVDFFLSTVKKTTVCKNLSSSRAIDDICKKYDCVCVPAAVGEINVANAMIKHNSLIGGEGNGGIMLADCHIGNFSLLLLKICLF